MGEAGDSGLERLQAIVAERGGGAYVVTVSDGQRPHAVFVPVAWAGRGLVAEVGARTAANAAVRPEVTILFPPRRDGDYSFVVDGTAAVSPGAAPHRLAVTPTRAVFHRPGPATDPSRSSCSADCVPVLEPRPPLVPGPR
jgi:hypothetical protein